MRLREILSSCALVLLASARTVEAAPADASQAAAIETDRFTHAGEGSVGKRRVLRTGCYQSESSGGTGGGRAHDSEAGCAAASVFAEMFAQADALVAGGALVPQEPAATEAAKGRARGPDLGHALSGARAVVIDTRGRRLVPKDAEAEKKLTAIVESEPTLDSWYVKPPSPPAGAGPQLIVLSAQRSDAKGSRHLQASLVATGSWWCHLSVPDDGRTLALPAAPKPLAPATATAVLGRVLAGVTARALAEAEAKGERMPDAPIGVEAAVGSGPRTPLRSSAQAARAAQRFGDEARVLAPACRLP